MLESGNDSSNGKGGSGELYQHCNGTRGDIDEERLLKPIGTMVMLRVTMVTRTTTMERVGILVLPLGTVA